MILFGAVGLILALMVLANGARIAERPPRVSERAKKAVRRLAQAARPVCASGACAVGQFGCCDRVFCEGTRRGLGALDEHVEWLDHQRLPLMGPRGCRVPEHLRVNCATYVCHGLRDPKLAARACEEAGTLQDLDLTQALFDVVHADPACRLQIEAFANPVVHLFVDYQNPQPFKGDPCA